MEALIVLQTGGNVSIGVFGTQRFIRLVAIDEEEEPVEVQLGDGPAPPPPPAAAAFANPAAAAPPPPPPPPQPQPSPFIQPGKCRCSEAWCAPYVDAKSGHVRTKDLGIVRRGSMALADLMGK